MFKLEYFEYFESLDLKSIDHRTEQMSFVD